MIVHQAPAFPIRPGCEPSPRTAASDAAPAPAPRRGIGGTRAESGTLHPRETAALADAASPAAPSAFAPDSRMPSARRRTPARRFEQHVDRWPREMHRLVGGERQHAPALDEQVVVRRRDIDAAGTANILSSASARPATLRANSSASAPSASAGMCTTTTTAPGMLAAAPASIPSSASIAPADPPMAISAGCVGPQLVERDRPSRAPPIDPLCAGDTPRTAAACARDAQRLARSEAEEAARHQRLA